MYSHSYYGSSGYYQNSNYQYAGGTGQGGYSWDDSTGEPQKQAAMVAQSAWLLFWEGKACRQPHAHAHR